jgi:hypothetical protein
MKISLLSTGTGDNKETMILSTLGLKVGFHLYIGANQ